MMLLTERLLAAARFVRQGARTADIGSDHAKLPIFLINSGIAEIALASDINEGPAERSRKAVQRAGLADRISVSVRDGLDGIESFEPTDIVIAGMGGELISRIIDDSDYPKRQGIRLILQPMTKPAYLREYLYSNGFDIVDEALADEGKIYQIIVSEYTGVYKTVPDEYLLIGEKNIVHKDPLLIRHIDGILASLEKRINGLTSSGREAEYEMALSGRIKSIRGVFI
ncbi:MAG: SAM-dependent methyltransferase [Clostridia bacterium]|nr:SAM-dependent methyltransferase [Clostridia bacterium]